MYFSTFTQARSSKCGVQLQGGNLKCIFKHNKAENERSFDEVYLEISHASVLIYISLKRPNVSWTVTLRKREFFNLIVRINTNYENYLRSSQ